MSLPLLNVAPARALHHRRRARVRACRGAWPRAAKSAHEPVDGQPEPPVVRHPPVRGIATGHPTWSVLQLLANGRHRLTHRAQFGVGDGPAEVAEAAVRRDQQPVRRNDVECRTDALRDLFGRLDMGVLASTTPTPSTLSVGKPWKASSSEKPRLVNSRWITSHGDSLSLIHISEPTRPY